MTALAAIAASMALPPSSRMCAPACEARNCGVETIPNFETTIERPCPGTDANCCAGTIPTLRIDMARNAKRFITPFGRAELTTMGRPRATLFHNEKSPCCSWY